MQRTGHSWQESDASRNIALSVVAPCYNEADGLQELYTRVTAVSRSVVGNDYELVLINDGSSDATWSTIRTLVERDPRVIGVDLSRNHGHQLALSAGLTVCRGDRILIIDADLQDPPELLPQMMALMDDGAEVVYGQRTARAGESWFKTSTASIFYRFLRLLTEVDIPPDTGDFRLMSRRALDVLNGMPEQHRFIRGMVSWIGLDQRPLFYERHPRFAGATKYPIKKMVKFAIDAITGFSIRPLRVAVYFGLLFGAGGIATLIYTLYSWATNQTIQGWTSLMIITLLLGSVQLFVTGVFGEYLGRLYLESKRRPLFVIREVARAHKRAAEMRLSADRATAERQQQISRSFG
jgi:glycosyltransferase involved in cell wall biosynthesis